MEKIDYVTYWIEESKNDEKSMDNIFAKGNENHWALFIGHLSVEKALKAVYVQNNEINIVPKIHRLAALAEAAGMEIDNNMFDKLSKITLFNIEARYPDYKKRFYELATNEYTKDRIKEIKEVLTWIRSKIVIF